MDLGIGRSHPCHLDSKGDLMDDLYRRALEAGNRLEQSDTDAALILMDVLAELTRTRIDLASANAELLTLRTDTLLRQVYAQK